MAIQVNGCIGCGRPPDCEHAPDCPYLRDLQIFAGLPTAPRAEYRVDTITLTGVVAGREVLLELTPQEDLTPRELLRINDLIQGRVNGNRMAYILDMGLIRHFTERPMAQMHEVAALEFKREIARQEVLKQIHEQRELMTNTMMIKSVRPTRDAVKAVWRK